MTRTEINRTRILEAPVAKTLARLTIPMIFGIFSMVAYNLADTFFVGRLGKDQLAALSFTFPVVLTISSLAQGIGMGTAAVVSRAIGGGLYDRVRRYATDSLVLGITIVAIGAILGSLTIEPLFTLLGAEGIILEYIGEYMRIWYIGMVFVVVPMVGNNIIRATGDSKTPGTIMVLGAMANFVLDPLLIFGFGPVPAFGIKGAAAATLIGRASTFCISMYVLIFREKLLSFAVPRVKDVLHSWKAILHIGIPNAGTKMIIPIGTGFITRVVASYGVAAVAGYGVATRLEFLSLAALNALSSIAGPFIGQNLGAKKLDRVEAAFISSGWFSLIVGASAFIVFLVFGQKIALLFNQDPGVAAATSLYMRIVSLTYSAQGFYLVTAAGLNVMRRPLQAAGLSLLEMFVLSVPLVLLGSYFFGPVGIFSAIAVSYTLTGGASVLMVRKVLSRYSFLS